MRADSIRKTFGVAIGVSVVCSILVSTTVVTLRKIREENERRTRISTMLVDLGLVGAEGRIKEAKERVRFLLVDLEKGIEVPEEERTEALGPDVFDIKALARDPRYGKEVPPDRDLAQIRVMPKFMLIYRFQAENKGEIYILPVYGAGLYSTMYGLIALGDDLRTIEGITFSEHGETPGLGGEIDNPAWKRVWKGKEAFDEQGNVKIVVIRGTVDTMSPDANHQIDGISGATYTTRGVHNLIRFWLGDDGYGPFVRRVQQAGADGKI